jgi:transposase
VKSLEQQQLQQLHALRESWKKSRTQRINLLRGIFRELGIEAPTSTEAFLRAAGEHLSVQKSGHCEASCR